MNIKRNIRLIIMTIMLGPAVGGAVSFAEDGYEFWLRYHRISDQGLLKECRELCREIVITESSPILNSARDELSRGLAGLLGQEPAGSGSVRQAGSIVVGSLQKSKVIRDVISLEDAKQLNSDGFLIRSVNIEGKPCTIITGKTDRAALYGVFGFLRLLQTHQSIRNLDIKEVPANPLRIAYHWDNMDGTVSRGYAGGSIVKWDKLPEFDPRYRDYARMLASVGINGCIIGKDNTAEDILKLAGLASVLRQYGVRIYTHTSFDYPVRLGGLETYDPLDPAVQAWWIKKANDIYEQIPDFGGFKMKADSEGTPGPRDYERSHAQGANVIARALEPYGGLVLWRAFVYGKSLKYMGIKDRARQACDFFKPFDGQFADNAILQIKNGPMDFQVREPVSPLFGAMPKTDQILELQVTQEYTGHSTHLCYLVPQWKEILDFDTYAKGKESTVKRIVSGSLFEYKYSGISGVINIGDDRNWTGHHLAQANTYGFGRLAWNPDLSAEQITDEWVRMTFGHDPMVVKTISKMLLDSWRIYENYTSPLGVGFMCETGPHYNPDPKGRQKKYHHGDNLGVGYDRTQATGSGYTAQYHPPVAKMYESLGTCPEELLLFFHHVPYTHRLKSGKTVIQHIYDSHFDGVEQARGLRKAWKTLKGKIDNERYEHVLARLEAQLEHARLWCDSINKYFFDLSGIPDEKDRLVLK